MKIQAMTYSGKPFLVEATPTGFADWFVVTVDVDRLGLLEVRLADGSKLWVSPVDCRGDDGEALEDSFWERCDLQPVPGTRYPSDAATATGMYDYD